MSERSPVGHTADGSRGKSGLTERFRRPVISRGELMDEQLLSSHVGLGGPTTLG